MSTQSRTASCSCQSLRALCEGEPASVSLCHCQDCQRRTGSAFGVAAFYPKDKVQVTGSASCFITTSEAGHDFSFYFCPGCGNTVYWKTSRKPDVIIVAAGAFADPDFPAPEQSVFEEHRHHWVKLSL